MQGRARTVVPYIWVSPSHIDIMLGLAWLARLSALKSLRGSHASRSTDFSLFAVPSLGRRNKDTREPLIPPCMRHGITGTQRETRRRIPFFFFLRRPWPNLCRYDLRLFCCARRERAGVPTKKLSTPLLSYNSPRARRSNANDNDFRIGQMMPSDISSLRPAVKLKEFGHRITQMTQVACATSK